MLTSFVGIPIRSLPSINRKTDGMRGSTERRKRTISAARCTELRGPPKGVQADPESWAGSLAVNWCTSSPGKMLVNQGILGEPISRLCSRVKQPRRGANFYGDGYKSLQANMRYILIYIGKYWNIGAGTRDPNCRGFKLGDAKALCRSAAPLRAWRWATWVAGSCRGALLQSSKYARHGLKQWHAMTQGPRWLIIYKFWNTCLTYFMSFHLMHSNSKKMQK